MRTDRIGELLKDAAELSEAEGIDGAVATILARMDKRDLMLVARRFFMDAVNDKRRLRTLRAERAAEREARERLRAETIAWVESLPPLTPEQRAENARRMEEIRAREEAKHEARMNALSQEIRQAVDGLRDALFMEWTEELLNSTFRLPNGVRVTWGDATVEQHEARAEMFYRQAAVNTEGAMRHEVAIRTLQAAGVNRLAELEKVAA